MRAKRVFFARIFEPARTAVTRICLNMIVKDEAPVIERCLASVKPWIDHWVIVDTGSGDGTQDVIRRYMADLPGTLHERPWRNFGHNRNEAMALARESMSGADDYLLCIDADETLRMASGFRWPDLRADGYQFRCELDGWQYLRNALVRARQPWRWEGVLHEFLTQDTAHTWQALPQATIVVARDGARARDPQTYLRDIATLEHAIRDEPANTRYRFYLAQSYRDAGKLDDALRVYGERATMGGWDEEVWFARFQVAVLRERVGESPAAVQAAYLDAYQQRPTRAEPLCELARYHRLRGEFALAHLFAQQAAGMSLPADALFVDESVYTWRALDELVVSAYYVGAQAQGREALQRLIADQRFPEGERARIVGNCQYFGL
ncbi:MAG: glycosyltransferase family 2 protein [Cupriavidus sp.]|nr:glycosyltransferase family 2 protein [Cupriavidus sp.]QWE97683.1 glycosyltransferase family 2 protein [Cupriavidus sp. EM10]MCA3192325.1 glycosyltransferase family 2 protein [Cupriavidus sp.]MCA3196100.1 glycosyltransferase family 2 protein [Cupriavidus sp.]MCA3203633.1 glycosyltransferase family 2 protein [Cupriavidus sp.]